MSSEFGKNLKVSVFGQSHGDAIGVTVSGLPEGESINFEELRAFMERRRGGKDHGEFLCSFTGQFGNTDGSLLCALSADTFFVRSK